MEYLCSNVFMVLWVWFLVCLGIVDEEIYILLVEVLFLVE